MSDQPDFDSYSMAQLMEAQTGVNRQKYPERAARIDALIDERRRRGLVDVRGRYPERIRTLPLFDGQFDAYRLSAEGADVLFATYPAGTVIESHTHDTDNYGVITRGELILTLPNQEARFATGSWYHVPAHTPHSARFLVDTEEIEFWFDPVG
ncbi:MAG: cupin domain-containing protein [Pseudomonadota bacterium]